MKKIILVILTSFIFVCSITSIDINSAINFCTKKNLTILASGCISLFVINKIMMTNKVKTNNTTKDEEVDNESTETQKKDKDEKNDDPELVLEELKKKYEAKKIAREKRNKEHEEFLKGVETQIGKYKNKKKSDEEFAKILEEKVVRLEKALDLLEKNLATNQGNT